MAAKLPMPEGSAEKLKMLLESVRTKDGFRRVLCVWLRDAMGMSSRQVAKAVGWSGSHVRDVQARYLRDGEAALEGPGRGGRRRQLMNREEEYVLLRGLRETASSNTLDFRAVFRAVEAAAGHAIAPSVVHRMLVRHGWGRRAMVITPRQQKSAGAGASPPTDSSLTYRDAQGRLRVRRSGAWQPLREEDGVGGRENRGPAG